MTNQSHPITPPPELVQQWMSEIWHEGTPVRVSLSDEHIATRAAQWGADTELEACIAELHTNVLTGAFYVGGDATPSWHHFALKVINKLRAARRTKPPGLAEVALKALPRRIGPHHLAMLTQGDLDAILPALERLAELEQQTTP